jgi:plasmid maintenance system antidote protein VapI
MAVRARSAAYVREWMESVGLIQADLVKKLDYPKAKANAIWNREQRLNEDIMAEVAALVNARPYELLMHPEDAYALRRLQALVRDAVRPVEPAPTSEPDAPPTPATPHRKAV